MYDVMYILNNLYLQTDAWSNFFFECLRAYNQILDWIKIKEFLIHSSFMNISTIFALTAHYEWQWQKTECFHFLFNTNNDEID